jgi:alkylhydroperoxidase family enzyme
VGRAHGVSEQQLRDLARYRESLAFSEVERVVLDLALAMANTPADVSSDLLAGLRRHFDDAQLVELAAGIAWENYRARFNRVFGVGPVGFSAGAACALPEPTPQP